MFVKSCATVKGSCALLPCSTIRKTIPRFPASWSQLQGGGSCLLFLSLTADVGALNNVIQFPVFHLVESRSPSVCGAVCVRVYEYETETPGWAEGVEQIYRAGCTGSRKFGHRLLCKYVARIE